MGSGIKLEFWAFVTLIFILWGDLALQTVTVYCTACAVTALLQKKEAFRVYTIHLIADWLSSMCLLLGF